MDNKLSETLLSRKGFPKGVLYIDVVSMTLILLFVTLSPFVQIRILDTLYLNPRLEEPLVPFFPLYNLMY